MKQTSLLILAEGAHPPSVFPSKPLIKKNTELKPSKRWPNKPYSQLYNLEVRLLQCTLQVHSLYILWKTPYIHWWMETYGRRIKAPSTLLQRHNARYWFWSEGTIYLRDPFFYFSSYPRRPGNSGWRSLHNSYNYTKSAQALGHHSYNGHNAKLKIRWETGSWETKRF